MTFIQVVVWLCVVQCFAVCFANSVFRNEPENEQTFLKRILMEENFDSLLSKVNNLTQRVEALEKENGELFLFLSVNMIAYSNFDENIYVNFQYDQNHLIRNLREISYTI